MFDFRMNRNTSGSMFGILDPGDDVCPTCLQQLPEGHFIRTSRHFLHEWTMIIDPDMPDDIVELGTSDGKILARIHVPTGTVTLTP